MYTKLYKAVQMINQNLSQTSSYEQDTEYTILHHVNKGYPRVLFNADLKIPGFKQNFRY